MGISSTGIGSGIDVQSIINQLTQLESRPLAALSTKAILIQEKMSLMGQIKSQVSMLSDAANKLTQDTAWNAVTVSSSRSSAVSGTVSGTVAPTSFSVEVSQLAKAQSTASTAVPKDTAIGTGRLTIELGTWDHGVNPPTFASGGAAGVPVDIGAGEDSLSAIAAKINAASAGVTATVLNDASGERLLLRSNSTGEEAGFRIQVTGDSDGNDADSQGLSRLAFDPQTGVFGMADNSYQKAQNTLATINNVAVTSGTNKLADAVPGLTLEFGEVTTSAVEIGIATDQTAIRKNIQDFMAAYNTLSRTLGDATKYDAETKTAGTMQGDSIVVGLQNVLRNVLGSSSVGGSFARLAEAGIEMQRGGLLTLAPAKFDAAMRDPANFKQLFASDNGNAQTNGFGLKVRDFARGLLAAGGTVSNKTTALEQELRRNSREQDKVNERVVRVEQRLRQQYSALDARMGSLTALNAYISQQVTLWNKTR